MYLLQSRQNYSNHYTYTELKGVSKEGALAVRDAKRRSSEETFRITRDGTDIWYYDLYEAHNVVE
jgi:hypothetical protein